MKFNIAKGIDVKRLDEELFKFSMTEKQSPYIFINKDTATALIAESIVDEPHRIVPTDKRVIAQYDGFKVFIDDTKEFGEVLSRRLWGGHLWNPSYFVATVSENTEEQIRKYIKN